MQINRVRHQSVTLHLRSRNDIPLQLKALGKGLISLNQRGDTWSVFKKIKTPMTMTIFVMSAATAVAGNRPVRGGDSRS
jgi:hypothetical protein